MKDKITIDIPDGYELGEVLRIPFNNDTVIKWKKKETNPFKVGDWVIYKKGDFIAINIIEIKGDIIWSGGKRGLFAGSTYKSYRLATEEEIVEAQLPSELMTIHRISETGLIETEMSEKYVDKLSLLDDLLIARDIYNEDIKIDYYSYIIHLDFKEEFKVSHAAYVETSKLFAFKSKKRAELFIKNFEKELIEIFKFLK